jgi:hypothetical protein
MGADTDTARAEANRLGPPEASTGCDLLAPMLNELCSAHGGHGRTQLARPARDQRVHDAANTVVSQVVR